MLQRSAEAVAVCVSNGPAASSAVLTSNQTHPYIAAAEGLSSNERTNATVTMPVTSQPPTPYTSAVEPPAAFQYAVARSLQIGTAKRPAPNIAATASSAICQSGASLARSSRPGARRNEAVTATPIAVASATIVPTMIQ